MKTTPDSARSLAKKSNKGKSHAYDMAKAGRLNEANAEPIGDSETIYREAKAKKERHLANLKELEEKRVRRELMDAGETRRVLSGIRTAIKSKLTFALMNRYPQLNDGLAAPQQRANNEKLLAEICREMIDAEDNFLKGLNE